MVMSVTGFRIIEVQKENPKRVCMNVHVNRKAERWQVDIINIESNIINMINNDL